MAEMQASVVGKEVLEKQHAGPGTVPNRGVIAWCVLCGALAGFVHAAPAAEELPIWERQDEIITNEGQIQVRLTPDSARNAEFGSFSAHAFHRTTRVGALFHGACRPFISVKVTASDTRKLDLTAFVGSRSGRDLPIHDVLEALRKGIRGQCQNVEAMRVQFAPAHQTEEDYTYTGTASSEWGWELRDGIVETAYDQYHRFKITVRDFFSVAGVAYEGGCSDDPILTVAPMYSNNQERALAKKPTITNVYSAARDAAAVFGRECPAARQVRFIVDPIPEDNECASEGECFLVARMAEGEWTVDSSQFQQRIVYSPIGEFADITEVLAAGEHSILDNYTNFFAFYFESFIGIYSDHCRSLIRDPVGREIQTIERTYDSDGFLVNEEPTGPPRKIVVERDYAASFDRYFGTWKTWGVNQMLTSMMKSNPNQQLGRVWESTTRAVGFFTGNYNDLERDVSARCRDDRIQTAYANMLNYAQGSTPITGKYATDKRPYVAPEKNQVSAPETAKRLADEAAARKADKSQAQLAAEARERERAEAHRKRIQEDIARRNAPRNATPPPGPGADELAAHQARVQAVQQQAGDLMKKIQELGQEFQQRIHAAKTPEERVALQQEFQKKQQEAMAEYQELIMQAQQQR